MQVELKYIETNELPMNVHDPLTNRIEIVFEVLDIEPNLDWVGADVDEVIIRFKPITFNKKHLIHSKFVKKGERK